MTFAVAFSILGSFLLFVSHRPLTLGSVAMCAAVSSAIASVYGDFDLQHELGRLTLSACADGTPEQTPLSAAQTCAAGIWRMAVSNKLF